MAPKPAEGGVSGSGNGNENSAIISGSASGGTFMFISISRVDSSRSGRPSVSAGLGGSAGSMMEEKRGEAVGKGKRALRIPFPLLEGR